MIPKVLDSENLGEQLEDKNLSQMEQIEHNEDSQENLENLKDEKNLKHPLDKEGV